MHKLHSVGSSDLMLAAMPDLTFQDWVMAHTLTRFYEVPIVAGTFVKVSPANPKRIGIHARALVTSNIYIQFGGMTTFGEGFAVGPVFIGGIYSRFMPDWLTLWSIGSAVQYDVWATTDGNAGVQFNEILCEHRLDEMLAEWLSRYKPRGRRRRRNRDDTHVNIDLAGPEEHTPEGAS